jgi:1,4-alpha-glucan branching enzyme
VADPEGPAGRFCLVLHGHLPWVLHHGRWPHGEDWLFEAASATWLPLLEVLDTCRTEGIAPRWTIGLTPILLEQLVHPRFREGLPAWLDERAERARSDETKFRAASEGHLAFLAGRWAARFEELGRLFEAHDGDLPGAFADLARSGTVELLTSNATHVYHPLLVHDATARGCLRVGLHTSERHLGFRPRGMWLPECAYRPPQLWWPPAVRTLPHEVEGTATLCAEEGVEFFFVDTALVRNAVAEAVIDGKITPVDSHQPDWDVLRGWKSELEPHRVGEHGRAVPLTVLARCPDVSEQVWSGKIGYPADPRYLEFHKRHELRGLRYWKVTAADAELDQKDAYHPDDVGQVVHGQAVHFCELVKSRLRMHRQRTGRAGVVCAPFDAELFGHWWYEGPRFLLEVARRMHHEAEIEATTVSVALDATPADKVVQLPEGSWGAGGDHRVWLNDDLRSVWEVCFRAEDRFHELLQSLPWEEDAGVRELLEEAARQLLLLLSSDWVFVVSTGGAVDYGLRRIFEHASLFEDLCNGAMDTITSPGAARDPVVDGALARSRLLDPVFPDLDLGWFR